MVTQLHKHTGVGEMVVTILNVQDMLEQSITVTVNLERIYIIGEVNQRS